jgi:hypothetical protein
MPTQDGLGPNDGYGAKDVGTATIEPNEQSAVDPTQTQCATWRVLLKHIELMPKDEDFYFQQLSWLKEVAQHTNEEEGNCDHQSQSCPDSVAPVTRSG